MTTTDKPRPLELFHLYSISEIHDKTAYSETYLIELRSGWRPSTDSFRRRVLLALPEPEAVLFALARDGDKEEETDGHTERNERSGRG